MKQMLHHIDSPMEQAQRRHRVTLEDSVRQLSPHDQAVIRQILSEKCDYVENEAFHQPKAQRKLFEEAPPIAKPDTSWYHPLMENVSDTRSLGYGVGAVLLTAAEERALFLQFNFCRFKVCQIVAQIKAGGDAPIKPELARDLLHWHSKTEAFRDQIAQTNLALVLAMAKRTRMGDVDFADLVSEGNMALLRAVDKFDAARGFKFSTYACRAILKAFSRLGVKHSKYRQLFPTDFDPKLEKSDFMERKRGDHEEACVDEIRKIIDENRADLSDIEQEVIEHRFALGAKQKEEPDASPLTLEQVGKIIGVTKERVRQIQNKALQKIRESLEGDYLR